MTTKTPKKRALQLALEAMGAEPYSYSGRSMYGRECVGVTVDYPEVVKEWAKTAPALGRARSLSDNMGKKYVVYFPSVPFVQGQ